MTNFVSKGYTLLGYPEFKKVAVRTKDGVLEFYNYL